MSPRKKYVIIGVIGGIGWLLAAGGFLAVYHLLNSSDGGVFSEMPSQEALKNMGEDDISSHEVESLLRDANATGISWWAINYYLEICDNLIDSGNINRSVFSSCSSLLFNTENNLQSVFDESWEHIEMINSTQRSTIE